MAFTGVTNAHGPSPQPRACRSPSCSLTTATGSNQTKSVWAVDVAKLVERSLLTPETRGLNPVNSKLLYRIFMCLLSTVLKRRKYRKRVSVGYGKVISVMIAYFT